MSVRGVGDGGRDEAGADADVIAPRIEALALTGEAPLDLDVIDLDAGRSGSDGLLFRYEGDEWVYNLSTKGFASGEYVIYIRLPGGEIYQSGFVLR